MCLGFANSRGHRLRVSGARLRPLDWGVHCLTALPRQNGAWVEVNRDHGEPKQSAVLVRVPMPGLSLRTFFCEEQPKDSLSEPPTANRQPTTAMSLPVPPLQESDHPPQQEPCVRDPSPTRYLRFRGLCSTLSAPFITSSFVSCSSYPPTACGYPQTAVGHRATAVGYRPNMTECTVIHCTVFPPFFQLESAF